MRSVLGLAAVYTAIGIAAAGSAGAQPTEPLPAYRGRLLGVYNLQTGETIEGAEVSDAFAHVTALTTRTGTVSLSFLPDGGSLVRIQKIGFQPQTIMVSIAPADTVPFTILLSPIVTTLPAVITKDSAPRFISPRLRAFEERRKAGFGHFITENQLRKADSRSMTDVLRGAGVKVGCSSRTPIACFALSKRAGCPFQIYIDGSPVPVPQDRDLEKIWVTMMGAVEIYDGAATVPTEYNMTGSACGVILFWTRERH